MIDRHLIESESWRRATRLGNRIALAAFGVGTVANIFGSVGFATLVIEGTLTSVFVAILIWVAAVLLRAVVRCQQAMMVARLEESTRLLISANELHSNRAG